MGWDEMRLLMEKMMGNEWIGRLGGVRHTGRGEDGGLERSSLTGWSDWVLAFGGNCGVAIKDVCFD